MNVTCSATPCPVILSSTCVFYEGANLIYTGINTNDSIQTALEKIDDKFHDAAIGYAFGNGIIQIAPGDIVKLGGALTEDTVIGGAFALSLIGTLQAAKFITTGGNSSQFVKGDGSLDATSYQPTGNYITALTGDGTANGPGSVAFALSPTGVIANTYGDSTHVPRLTVDSKGRITNITNTLITIPSALLLFSGDVSGTGMTGANVTLTLSTVNANVYGIDTFLKFGVNGKGLVTSASPINGTDINLALGYIPVPQTRTLTINGVTYNLSANRSWTLPTLPSQTGHNGEWLTTDGTTASWASLPAVTPAALTKIDDTNITLTLGGSSNTALLQATSLTLGWTGTLADSRITSASTWNAKQNALSGTGFVTISGTTISYDNTTYYPASNPAGYISTINGIAAGGELSGTYVNPSLVNSAVIGKVLTGLNLVGGGTIVATDSILQAFGKVQNQISAMMGGVTYQGTWNATTNFPILTSSIGTKGYYYIVSVAGSTNLDGITDWKIGDWVIFNGSTWDKVDNTDAVSSVNGYTGTVSLTTADIAEVTNLYYLDSRARLALSLTTIGSSGAATYDNTLGIWNIPNYTISGLGGVPTSRTLTINGTGYDMSADRSWSVGTVTSVGLTMPSAFTVGSSPVTGSGTIAVTGAGTVSDYIRGDGTLEPFPNILSVGGGGVVYYMNGSVASTVGGYEQLSTTPIIGAGTDFNLTGNGLICSFLTDVSKPNSTLIPAGNWNFQFWASMNNNGGTPNIYFEICKYDGATFTVLATSLNLPITYGTSIYLYQINVPITATTILATDRIAIRIYSIINPGRITTIHTEDTHICQVISTFSRGISSINGLTAITQYFATGTAGIDFGISSVTDTHTFNIPTASASNRGLLSTTDWTNFNTAYGWGNPSGVYLPLAGANYGTTTGTGLALTSSTVTTGNLMSLTNTGTVATSNTKNVLSIVSSGANGTASQTVTGQTIRVTNTGTTNTNVGLNVTASGATNNYAALFTGNVGIGTTTPANTLDVVRGIAGTMTKGTYETASFERNADMKFGIYTSSASAADGASIAFGQTNLTAGSVYPGFEMQYTYSATNTSNAMKFNYVGRNSSGVVTSYATDILKMSANGDVIINGGALSAGITASPRLGIGTTSPTSTLHTAGSFATAYTTTAVDLAATAAMNVINVSVSGKIITLPTAIGIQGRQYTIINSSSDNITITTTSSQLIGNFTTATTIIVLSDKSMTLVSDNVGWKIKTYN